MSRLPTDSPTPHRSASVHEAAFSSPLTPTENHDVAGSHRSLAAANLERQEDELTFLQSVYMEDCEDLRGTNVWKTRRPLDVLLRLSPLGSAGNIGDGEGVFAAIEMRVRCSSSYPADPPEISLDKEKGLSKDQVKTLSADLTVLSHRLKGEVMILELAQHVKDFLHKHNHPPAKSFHEQMLSNQKRKEERKKEEEKRRQEEERKKLDKQARDVDEEIERTQRALKEERKGKRTLRFNSEAEVVEFEWTKNDALTGVSDVAGASPPFTSSRLSGMESTGVTNVSPVIVIAAATVAATSPSRARKPKPLKDGVEDRRSHKASSPIAVMTTTNGDHPTANVGASQQQQRRRQRLSSSDNSDGCGSPHTLAGRKAEEAKTTPPPTAMTTTMSFAHSPSSSPTVSSGDYEGKEARPCHRETTYLTFTLRNETRTVLRGRCIGHGLRGSSAFVGMDKSNGELVAIKVSWTTVFCFHLYLSPCLAVGHFICLSFYLGFYPLFVCLSICLPSICLLYICLLPICLLTIRLSFCVPVKIPLSRSISLLAHYLSAFSSGMARPFTPQRQRKRQ